MNYGQVRDQTLRLMGQYSLDGRPIPESYNGQGDLLLRIPGLIDDAQDVIAAGPRRIRAAKELRPERGRAMGGLTRYVLPEDLIEIIPGGLLVLRGSGQYESGAFRFDERHVLIETHPGEQVWLSYYRRPERVSAHMPSGMKQPPDALELDNAPEAHRAIPYYAAAHLMMHIDAYAYAALYNEWQARLLALYRPAQPQRAIVEDVYGWGAYDA